MWFDEWNTAYQVEKNLYCSSPFHRLIGVLDSPGHPSLQNIGYYGENLSIAIISLNRADLSIELMRSIADVMPDFKGVFLIADNGSDRSELDKLYQFSQKMPYTCQIEELGKNYGTTGGRNRMMRLAKTDWVLSVDNDMVFTSNIIPQAQEDIATLGVQFLTVPFINNGNPNDGVMGRNLVMENIDGRVNANIGPALSRREFIVDKPSPGYLCTALGTAVIYNKHTFMQVGGFDEGMFIGFEDMELSLRLFQAGYKVGAMAMVGMSHNHLESKKNADVAYEKIRFSKQQLYNDAMYFERKHGVGVWNRVAEEWLSDRQRAMKIASSEGGRVKKIRVALIIDRPDSALDNTAEQIVRYCQDAFDFARYYTSDTEKLADLLIGTQNCDIIHFLCPTDICQYYTESVQARIEMFGYTEDQFRIKYISQKLITTSAYDRQYSMDEESEIVERLFASPDSIVDAYSVSSRRLKDQYDNQEDLRLRPAAIITDGVDLTRFKPSNLERFNDTSHRTVRFCRVGPDNRSLADDDIKAIVESAIEELKEQGYDIELAVFDQNLTPVPHHQMSDYYAQFDCCLSVSPHEGAHGPVMEAMGCGLPVISTDDGIIAQMFGEKQKAFILGNGSKEELTETIKRLLDHPSLFAELSQENLRSIQDWDWSICAKRFIPFWRECLEQKRLRQM